MSDLVDRAHECTTILMRSVGESLRNRSDENIAVMFSGGLDSAVLARMARNFGDERIRLYTIGLEDSRDIINAREGGLFIGSPLEISIVDEGAVENGAQTLLELVPDLNFLELSFELPLFLGMSRVNEKVIMTGQGADELFGGYAKYRETDDRHEIIQLMKDDTERLMTRTCGIEHSIASHFHKELITPFLNERVVEYAASLDLEDKIGMDGSNKIILRETARILGLPEMMCSRPKLAAQYGSGISRVLKRLKKLGKLNVVLKTEY